jgi:outer membrane protein assembly factor BamB
MVRPFLIVLAKPGGLCDNHSSSRTEFIPFTVVTERNEFRSRVFLSIVRGDALFNPSRGDVRSITPMLKSRVVSFLVVPAILLAGIGMLAIAAQGGGGQVQGKKAIKGDVATPPQPKQPEVKPGTKYSAIKLVENEEDQNKINNALDAVEGGDWQAACEFLQAILDGKQDSFISIEVPDPKTGTKSHSISVKRQANILLASLPPAGLNTYELRYGSMARKMLDEAKKSGNRAALGEVASRYLHTKAGAEANELLATSFLDRGDYFPAAMLFRRMLGADPAKAKVSDLTLFKAALAFRRAGEDYASRAQELEEILAARIKSSGGLALANGQVATLKQVQAVLKEKETFTQANPHDWSMVNGNNARNAQANGSPPMLDYVLWARKTLMDKSDETGETEIGENAKAPLETAIKDARNIPNMPVMSGGFPVASGGILFYRTYAGITAAYLHDVLDKEGNVEAKAGSIHWKSMPFEGALGNILEPMANRSPLMSYWIPQYRNSSLYSILFENSTVGTLTTDNRMVYAVDDLALPIPSNWLPGTQGSTLWTNSNYLSDDLRKLVMQNKLRAHEISSGKFAWELTGTQDKTDEFKNSHFLCAPISVGGKLYVLNEKNNGELRLVCLEAQKIAGNSPQKKDEWVVNVVPPIQKLGTVKNEHAYYRDSARRVNAIHLAYSEGILVCPTNAGELFGVDLLSQSLAWAYKYRERPVTTKGGAGQLTLTNSNWKVSPPVIVDGKVVFTAPDSNSICCLNLRDGSEIWSVPQQESDLFLAGVFLDKVIIVAKNSMRALRLSDGVAVAEPLVVGDLPSGQGVASNNVYYLPLRRGEICAIDLATWSIKAHNQTSRTGGEPPGNLVFCEGMVLSQTPTAIVAYPQLFAKLAEAEEAYKKDPSLPKLLSRGELRLADGQAQKAAEDLALVLTKDPPKAIAERAQNRLFEAMSQLLTSDFATYAPRYLKEFKELTVVPGRQAEQQERQARYWLIVGQGREHEGALVEALEAFKEYGNSPLFLGKGIPSLEDPLHKVPAAGWFRGRISAMFSRANPAQRAALDKKIAQEWAKLRAGNDLEAVRRFAAMFDVPLAVGREARLELANMVIDNKAKDDYLEAELDLLQLRVGQFKDDPQTGGRALEALARLEAAKGSETSLRTAAAYFQQLDKEFAKSVIRDGKTGVDLFGEIAGSERWKPLLQEQAINWGDGEIKCREERGTVQGYRGFVFQPEGDLPPLLEKHRLVLDQLNSLNPTLWFVDVANNKERWKLTLPHIGPNVPLTYLYGEQGAAKGLPNARHRFYHVKGHLAVIQVGLAAFGLDLDQGKVLWQHLLFGDNKGQGGPVNFNPVSDDQGVWLVQSGAGQTVKFRVGQIGAVQANYVALVTQRGLVALDPVSGVTLWIKANVPMSCEVFGDDQHVFYIETANGAAVGNGRCLRASDGAPVDIPDFAYFYRNQQRIIDGRQILSAEANGRLMTMRLYDVVSGKDVWKRTFNNDPAALHTEEAGQCGVIERETGKLILVDSFTGKDIVTANLKQFRITEEDLKELHQPLLLDDGQRYYVALNTRPSNPKILNNSLANNFSSGTRCLPVNGWICCLDRKGEFLWHGHDRFQYQMIVVEQFKMLPMLLFSSRYTEQIQNGPASNLQYIARSGCIAKADGKSIWWAPDAASTNSAQFYAFTIDPRTKSVNMIGNLVTYRLYVDDKGLKK